MVDALQSKAPAAAALPGAPVPFEVLPEPPATPPSAWQRYLPVALAIVVGVALSALAAVLDWRREGRDAQVSFDLLAATRVAAVRRGLETDLQALDSLAAFFAATHTVDRPEFRRFVQPLLGRHPGIQALAWAPRVPDAQRAQYEQEARRDGYPDFQFTEFDAAGKLVRARPRPEYFPTYYREPFDPAPVAAGFDHASEPGRAEALRAACAGGGPVATGRVRLADGDDGGGTGVVVYRAVHGRALAPTTGITTGAPAARATAEATTAPRREVTGVVVAVIRLPELIDAAWSHLDTGGLRLVVRDQADQALLFGPAPALADRPAGGWFASMPLRYHTAIDVASRRWQIVCTPTAAYLAANRMGSIRPWTVLLAGLSFTALLGAYLTATLGRAAQVERLVAVRTAELATANRSLEREVAGHQRTLESLRDSEAIYHSLVETLPASIFRKDLQGRFTFGNQNFCQALGRPLAEIVQRTDRDFFPPELAEKYRRDDRQVIQTGEVYEAIEEHRDPGGTASYVQVLKGPVFDARRQIIGIEGIFWDVTDRKRAEHALRTNEEMLSIARQIQDGLYPHGPPVLPGFDIAGVTHPAEAVGGDYYDFIPLPNGNVGVVVGDASGHGIGPALLMAQARACLRTLAHSGSAVADVLRQANRVLSHGMLDNRFVTMLLVHLEPAQRRLVYCGAGHPAGYVMDRDGQVKAQLDSIGAPLGIAADNEFAASSPVDLAAGDLVLLVTDGVTEAIGPGSERFGIARALEVARAHRDQPASQIVTVLCQAVHDHCRHHGPHDDLTAVVIRVEGS